jgi:uncharacterized oxidoreductase
MQISGNTVFITGATSGIGQGLAEALYERGNRVIVSGRREERLQEICRKYPGMRSYALDVRDRGAIAAVAARTIADVPEINWVINNAGVQKTVTSAGGGALDEEALTDETDTNLLGPIRVAAAFLPHLRTRPGATLVNVSSGLAFVPLARFPIYCATKAAIHSWTLSLRHQLRDTGVKVIELIPPYVATELGGPDKPRPSASSGRGPMPLDAFIAETMKELETGADELAIGGAKYLMATVDGEALRARFTAMNDF